MTATASNFNEERITRAGGVVSAGIEKAIDDHWRVKVEYLHGFRLAYLLRGTGLDDTIRLHDNIARVGINYRFLP